MDLPVENRLCNFFDFENELLDSGVFENNRYFDVFAEYTSWQELAFWKPKAVSNQITKASFCAGGRYLLPGAFPEISPAHPLPGNHCDTEAGIF